MFEWILIFIDFCPKKKGNDIRLCDWLLIKGAVGGTGGEGVKRVRIIV